MKELINKANQCLLCKNPRCKQNCPINTDIPTIISLYKDGKIKEAGEILFDNNPLSAICGIVCPHENQCLGNCVKGIKGEPVEFYKIEKEISTEFLKGGKLVQTNKNNKKVAVVGSGPAGLTISVELIKKGYDVTVFEKNEKLGGILRYGIPEFRLDRDIIDNLINLLKKAGVKFKVNTSIGQVITIDKLFEDGYDAVFIGTGVWNPKRLNIKGETLGNSYYAINYLKSPKKYDLGEKVVIIGAGNVAMDAARSAKYYGAKEVHVVYRRDFSDMAATKVEIMDALEEGVEFLTYKAPVEIYENGIVLADTKKIANEDGNNSVIKVENSESLFECDSILIAVSQIPRNTIISNNESVKANDKGLIIIDREGNTSREGVFSSGDVTHGPKTVIEAVVSSKKVANSIDNYLKSKRNN
ncbi:NAD(P)-dependent oxidoreductase [Romboutsia lituseburensis]|uniref:NAD(P)-dependent oxidoreductase n=1 Tax=Romboutsia lituseburensis TaxID=1537 RepID=UPI00215AE3EA|nr:NAD(P)-dependent oxidoreductase [Romboutsia lituseburensis]MCR8746243.1 NAD(P)-dependent oxidoreductase [Romboutsia lituseburensis]